MSALEEKHAPSDVKLTPTQTELAQSVVDALRTPEITQTLIIINGLSGIGKSTVLDKLTGVLPQYNATVVDTSDIKYREPKVRNSKQHFVTTTTIGDFDATADEVRKDAVKNIPGISVQVIDLPGMNKKEILEYITRLKHTNTLSSDQIASYSMGIPLLAEKMALSGIDAHIASQLAAQYLKESFRQVVTSNQLVSVIRPFLQMPVPTDTQNRFDETAQDWNHTYIYENLLSTLEKQKKLERRGIVEDSPLFLAPESEAIYNQMLKNGENNSPSWIDIFVPELPVATLAKLQQAFGSKGGAYFWDYPARVEMFSATSRKVSIWHKDEQGQEVIYEGEYQMIQRMGQALTEAFQNKELPIVSRAKGPTSFYVHAHDHAGMVTNPVQIGWLTESLLQQNGIPYFVLNRTLASNYAYDPARKHIIMAPGKIDLKKYLDRGLYDR